MASPNVPPPNPERALSRERRRLARSRALRLARAITLGGALGSASTAATGCEQLADRYCQTFDENSWCCTRTGGTWDEARGACDHVSVFAMPGPFVPPHASPRPSPDEPTG